MRQMGWRGDHTDARPRREMTRLLPNRRGGHAVNLTATRTTVFQDDRVGVQIIGERHNEKKQH